MSTNNISNDPGIRGHSNDVLHGKETKIPLYNNQGFVILHDVMPRVLPVGKTTMDYAIPEMARVSYGNLSELKSDKDDERLINYLIENQHTSPLEGIKFKFIISCPIFVARQLLRHRTANVNEYSMRYSEAIDAFYYPELRYQDTVNKQSSIDIKKDDKTTKNEVENRYQQAIEKSKSLLDDYKYLIDNGIAREVARTILPVSEMTKMYFCLDLHNLFKFLKLRMDSHAQKEIQDLASAMFRLIQQVVPVACSAFISHQLNSILFSSLELKVLQSYLSGKDTKDTKDTNFNGMSKRQITQVNGKIDKIIKS